MKKRMIALILVFILLAVVFTGCQSKEAESSSPQQPSSAVSEPASSGSDVEPPAAQEEPEAPSAALPLCDELTDITGWMSINPGSLNYIDGWNDNSVYKEAERLTNVHFEVSSVAGNLAREQFSVIIAGGDLFDLMGNMKLYEGSYSAAVDDGLIYDIADQVQEYAPDYWSFIEADKDLYRIAFTDEGYLPGFLKISSNAFAQTGMIIRQDWLDSLNVSMPETYDDLHNVLTAFKTELGADSALFLTPIGTGAAQSFSAGYGICGCTDQMLGQHPFMVKDGVVSYSYLDDGFLAYLQMVNTWYNKNNKPRKA